MVRFVPEKRDEPRGDLQLEVGGSTVGRKQAEEAAPIFRRDDRGLNEAIHPLSAFGNYCGG